MARRLRGSVRPVRLVLMALLVALPVHPALADPIVSITTVLQFETQDQSMWGTGPGQVQKGFVLPIVDIHESGEIGEITTLGGFIPNPKYLAWFTAYQACRGLFSDAICRNGATIPFVGHVGGLGNPPPQTVFVNLGKNGLELSYDVDITAGLKGDLIVDEGSVHVTYPTTATLTADQAIHTPGEIVRLAFGETAGIPTMSTEFANLDLSLKAFADLDVEATLEAYAANVGGTIEFDFDTHGPVEQELFGASIGDGQIGIRVFGFEKDFDVAGGANVPGLKVKYPPADPFDDNAGPFTISLADFKVQLPSLDTQSTAPYSTWDPDAFTILNTQMPGGVIDRNITDEDLTFFGDDSELVPIDVAKLDIDVDGILSVIPQPPIPLGLSAGIPLVVGVEGNLLDFDLGAILSIGQEMVFHPELWALLQFSEPVQIETTPGVFSPFSEYSVRAGETLSFLQPDGDLTIDSTYELRNSFSNLTQLFVTPVATIQVLQLALTGLAPSALDLDFNAALVHKVIPLTDPIPALTLCCDDPFLLAGFQTFEGGRLLLEASDAAEVPEPVTLVLLASGLAVAGLRRRRARR